MTYQVSPKPSPADRVLDAGMRLKIIDCISWENTICVFLFMPFSFKLIFISNYFHIYPLSLHNAAGFSRERDRERVIILDLEQFLSKG